MTEQALCLDQIVLDSAKEIFETMIFMDILENEDSNCTIEGDAVLSSITFKGNLEGCLSICCGKQCAQTITMNMLGVDSIDDISDDDLSDAMGEVANMVMGTLKKRIYDIYADVQLSIPVVVNGRQLKNNLGEGTQETIVSVTFEDEFPATLSLLYREAKN